MRVCEFYGSLVHLSSLYPPVPNHSSRVIVTFGARRSGYIVHNVGTPFSVPRTIRFESAIPLKQRESLGNTCVGARAGAVDEASAAGGEGACATDVLRPANRLSGSFL